MLRFNTLAEIPGHIVPNEQIHAEGQIAFIERLPQFRHSGGLLCFGERHQVQIGRRV